MIGLIHKDFPNTLQTEQGQFDFQPILSLRKLQETLQLNYHVYRFRLG